MCDSDTFWTFIHFFHLETFLSDILCIYVKVWLRSVMYHRIEQIQLFVGKKV